MTITLTATVPGLSCVCQLQQSINWHYHPLLTDNRLGDLLRELAIPAAHERDAPFVPRLRRSSGLGDTGTTYAYFHLIMRLLINLLAGLLAVLAVLLLSLAITSCFRYPVFQYYQQSLPASDRTYVLGVDYGCARVNVNTWTATKAWTIRRGPPNRIPEVFRWRTYKPNWRNVTWGVNYKFEVSKSEGENATYRTVNISLWPLVVLFGTWPLVRFSRILVRRRRFKYRAKNGLCIACGYDLRSSPERCPECGKTYG